MRRHLVAAIAAAALLATPASAAADGDPASDVLTQQDAFFPYTTPTPDGVARALLALTAATRRAGWPIKVAIIAAPTDLGAVGSLFTNPQQYADLLAREIAAPRLLVVTPQGFGGQQLGDGVDRALAGLAPARADGDALARQALTAVSRLAQEDGHGVPTPEIDESAAGRRPYRDGAALHPGAQLPATAPAGSPRRGGGGSTWWLYAGPAIVLVVALIVLNARGRRAQA
ncbi:MAG TPA: hypothetical protein VGO80_23155 [Solirubrobacteraceae bacterium]|jgi:hypothetical protein|nr:hypothetical protein [Solirubrobacteraceae bacterium]